MAWFRRSDKGILTPTEAKREVPDGLWFRSPKGKIVHTRELKHNAFVVPDEDYHVRIGSKEYFELLFDHNEFTELDAEMEHQTRHDTTVGRARPMGERGAYVADHVGETP